MPVYLSQRDVDHLHTFIYSLSCISASIIDQKERMRGSCFLTTTTTDGDDDEPEKVILVLLMRF